ncbi:16904_t:CDS:2, partial [Racocetra persica]
EPTPRYNLRTQNRNPDNQTTRPHRCYQCNQEGHISKNCPTRVLQPQLDNQRRIITDKQPNGPKVRGINIQYLEVTEAVKNEDSEYLKIELKESGLLFNVRNLDKRRHVEEEHEMPSWAQKGTYVETPEEINNVYSYHRTNG